MHQLLDGVDRLLLGPTAGVAQDRQLERAADDGRGGQDLGRRLADRPDPFEQERLDAPGQLRAGAVAARDGRDDVERQPFGVGRQRIDPGVVDDGVRAHGAHDRRDVLSTESIEHDRRDIGQAREIGDRARPPRPRGPPDAMPAAGTPAVPTAASPGTRVPPWWGRRPGAGRPPRSSPGTSVAVRAVEGFGDRVEEPDARSGGLRRPPERPPRRRGARPAGR